MLYPLHERLAEEPDDGGIDPGGHQAERVAGGDEAVVGLQVLELRADDADARQAVESLTKGVAHRLFGVNQPDRFEHRRTPTSESGKPRLPIILTPFPISDARTRCAAGFPGP